MEVKPLSPKELFQLFQADRLVVHTMPVEIALKERPLQLCSNKSQLKCGSIFFWRGLQHKDGHHVPNAVARFGDKEHAERTVFATLHDLSAIFETHKQLEQQKTPESNRGPPFVLFSNSDIGNLAKEQPPPDDYMEAVWGKAQTKKCQRPIGFDFRQYCSTKREKDDPSMEQEGVEWNELRAVLNRDNMVGLLYIHDPKCSPEQHADEAKQLNAAFDHQYTMGVFTLKDKGGVQGDLLTVDGSSSSDSSGGGRQAGGSNEGGSNDGSRQAGGSNGSNEGGSNGGRPQAGGSNGSNEGGSSGGGRQAGGSNGSNEGGSNGGSSGKAGAAGGIANAGGGNAEGGVAVGGNAQGDVEEGEVGGDHTVDVVDQQQKGRKKRRLGSPAAEAGDGEGCRLLTFDEYLLQRAGKQQLAVSAK